MSEKTMTSAYDITVFQVEFMRNLEDRDDEYKSMLNQKIQIPDSSGLIQVYNKELGDRLAS